MDAAVSPTNVGYVPQHAYGIRDQIDLGSGLRDPVDWDFRDVQSEFTGNKANLDVERKSECLLARKYASNDIAPKHLEPALSIRDPFHCDHPDEKCKHAADDPSMY